MVVCLTSLMLLVALVSASTLDGLVRVVALVMLVVRIMVGVPQLSGWSVMESRQAGMTRVSVQGW